MILFAASRRAFVVALTLAVIAVFIVLKLPSDLIWRVTLGFPLKINVFLIREGDGVAVFDSASRQLGPKVRELIWSTENELSRIPANGALPKGIKAA